MAHSVLSDSSSPVEPPHNGARDMTLQQRRDLAIRVLAKNQPVTDLAQANQVSRKFAYAQKNIALRALEKAFVKTAKDEEVLFYLPVTRSWLLQFVLALVLIGHCPFRAVVEILRDLFDLRFGLGRVHAIVLAATMKARLMQQEEDLSHVQVGLHDEIYQEGQPVLVGLDALSLYCYLLSVEEHADETTWGVRLLEAAERGLAPDHTVADGGSGLRAGQAEAWPGVPCYADVFHAERDFQRVVQFLDHRARRCSESSLKLQRRVERATHPKSRTPLGADEQKLHAQWEAACREETDALCLAKEMHILGSWLRTDVLSAAGQEPAQRRALFDLLVAEVRQRESLCSHRIRPLRTMLENQRDNLLAFAEDLDQCLRDVATRFDVPFDSVQAVYELELLSATHPLYWQRRAQLFQELHERMFPIEQAVRHAMHTTTRASSLVENLNSRLRSYFFLRRHIGNDYLELLRFFLNHRPFQRSERAERQGKSPKELLTGQPHPHWLEMLGFERFHR